MAAYISPLIIMLGLVSAPAMLKAEEDCDDDPRIDIELRQLCDIVAAGIRRLPGDARYLRTAVAPFSGAESDASAMRTRQMLADYLAIGCLDQQHRLPVIHGAALPRWETFDDRIQTDLTARGIAVVVAGDVARGPGGYAVSTRVLAVESGEELTSSLRLLPDRPLDEHARCIVEPKTRGGALLRSLVAPGWGQIYNDEPIKGGLFIAAEAGLLAAALGSELAGRAAREQYDYGDLRTVGDNDRARDHFTRRTLFLALAGSVWLYAIVDAYLNGHVYRPDEVYRSRLRMTPGASGGFEWKW